MTRQDIESGISPRSNRKKLQRYVTKNIRKINKMLEEDDLWQGRFVVRQINYDYYHFDDNSGGELYIRYNVIDKKTGIIKTYGHNVFGANRFWIGDMNRNINNFIVDIVKVWEYEKPYDEKRDWTNVPLPNNWHDFSWDIGFVEYFSGKEVII